MDDILGEESDNESEGQGKERPGEEEVDDDDDDDEEDEDQRLQQQQQLGARLSTGGEHTAPSLAVAKDTGLQTPVQEAGLTSSVQR